MDDIGLKLCELQAKIFEESKNYFTCSSVFFIRNYMNSNLASRMDNKNFIFEANSEPAYLKELNINKSNSTDQFPSFILYWIGYLYRFASYKYNLASKKIYSIIKPKELFALYEAYHSLDPDEAVKRIFEAKGIDINNINYSKELAKKIFMTSKQ